MVGTEKSYDLTELMQDNYTDLDIVREKPFVFKVGKYLLISAPVRWGEYDKLLKDMGRMLQRHVDIFIDLDFLNTTNYKEKKAIEKIISHIQIFEANKEFTKFKKDTIKFICRWGFVSTKKKGLIKFKHSPRTAKKILNMMTGSDVVYFLFLLFVFNFDIVKKNLGTFMEIFQGNEQKKSEQSSPGMRSSKNTKKVVTMPKFSEKPYSKEVLEIFAQQSLMS